MTNVTRRLSYKMYPDAAQAAALDEKARLLRQLWNAALEERIGAYRLRGESIGFAAQCRSIRLFAPEVPGWRGRVHTHEAQVVLKRLQTAFESFFRRVRAGGTPGFPRFKGEDRFRGWGYKEHGNGFRLFQDGTMRHGRLRLFGVSGLIPLRGRPRTPGRVLAADVTRRRGQWFLSVVVETECAERAPAPAGSGIGFDLGVETALTGAHPNGTFSAVPNPRHLAAEAEEIRDAQRALSKLARERKVSRGAYRRHRKALARKHAKVAARRKDAHHKLSAALVRDHALIVTETLSISGMTRSARGDAAAPGTNVAQKAGLNRSLLDAGMASFLNMVRYKAEEAGSDFLEADTRRLKPSQRCPDCDRVRKKPLSQRVHHCECGCRLGRDQAAARVLLNWGTREAASRLHPAGAAGALTGSGQGRQKPLPTYGLVGESSFHPGPYRSP